MRDQYRRLRLNADQRSRLHIGLASRTPARDEVAAVETVWVLPVPILCGCLEVGKFNAERHSEVREVVPGV